MRSTALIAGLLLSVGATGASAGPIVQAIDNHRNDIGEIHRRGANLVHTSSGYVYPPALGEMPARKTITYGPRDAEVYYTLRGGGNGDPWISLFVYPAKHSLAAEARIIEKSIQDSVGGKSVEAPASLQQMPPGTSGGWHHGFVRGVGLLSGYRVTRQGNWFIKARITIPDIGGNAATSRAARGLAAIPWDVAGQ